MTGARAAGPAPSSRGPESDTLLAYGPILTADVTNVEAGQVSPLASNSHGNARPGPFGLSREERQCRPVSARRRRFHDAPRHVGRDHFQAFPVADVLSPPESIRTRHRVTQPEANGGGVWCCLPVRARR